LASALAHGYEPRREEAFDDVREKLAEGVGMIGRVRITGPARAMAGEARLPLEWATG
jgi:hypothetical protein